MPTYRARGVTATLRTCDLADSLSETIKLDMGKAQQRDADRISKVLAAGIELKEIPIAADGSESGVLQHIGNNSLPLLCVETGQGFGIHPSRRCMLAKYLGYSSAGDENMDYTSVGEVPRLDTAESAQTYPSLADADHLSPEPHALSLSIEIGAGAQLLQPKRKLVDTDIKVEVFLNGNLVDVEYINTRRVGFSCTKVFSGTRLHRQVEKPWICLPHCSVSSSVGAEKRWNDVNDLLRKEAMIRGFKASPVGEISPTCAYLASLSNLLFPSSRLVDKAYLGIVDVVICSGSGVKHGPGRGHIVVPTRMENTKFPVDSAAEKQYQRFSEMSVNHEEAILLKPAVPNVRTMSMEVKDAFRRLEAPPTKDGDLIIGNYINIKGRSGKDRKLSQRIVDTAQITNSGKREKAIRKLKEQVVIDQDASTTSERTLVTPSSLSPIETPKQSSTGLSCIGGDATLSAAAQQRATPQDQSVEEAVSGFKVPPLCEGSILTYAPGTMQRQVRKSRPGRFDEDEIVVGMRFVVV